MLFHTSKGRHTFLSSQLSYIYTCSHSVETQSLPQCQSTHLIPRSKKMDSQEHKKKVKKTVKNVFHHILRKITFIYIAYKQKVHTFNVDSVHCTTTASFQEVKTEEPHSFLGYQGLHFSTTAVQYLRLLEKIEASEFFFLDPFISQHYSELAVFCINCSQCILGPSNSATLFSESQ